MMAIDSDEEAAEHSIIIININIIHAYDCTVIIILSKLFTSSSSFLFCPFG